MSREFSEYDLVKYWLYTMHIKDYTIKDDLTVDVNTGVTISNTDITNIPIQFGKVNGFFHCSYNKLTSLQGCPREVNGRFTINNRLTSLDGGPILVRGDYNCSNNKLTSLKGIPKIINDNFSCRTNNLTILEGCPEEVNGDFNCNSNKLLSLKYLPNKIKGNFKCEYNKELDSMLKIGNYDIILKYQEEYGLWYSDGSFNKKRFNIFLNYYKAGILT